LVSTIVKKKEPPTRAAIQKTEREIKRGERLDDSDLVGNIESVDVNWELNESLLLSVRSDEGSDLGGGDLVHLLDGVDDLVLVGQNVDDEDQGVVVLDSLHGGLSGEWMSEDTVLIQLSSAGSRSARILRLAGQTESLWTLEVDRGVDLVLTNDANTTLDDLVDLGGLSDLLGFRGDLLARSDGLLRLDIGSLLGSLGSLLLGSGDLLGGAGSQLLLLGQRHGRLGSLLLGSSRLGGLGGLGYRLGWGCDLGCWLGGLLGGWLGDWLGGLGGWLGRLSGFA
jgi:hypothetical protein